ncbi:MAG TPA: RNA-binding S4 domain-containing protein [Usitatibacteraceae bacterium]|nr:RNA-binding S4 domain-containing protein [Usitatibacteraceae bacterium]
MGGDADKTPGVRADKWLWAARFFKTRQLAVEAIGMGRVEVNGERIKPAKSLKVGDRLLIRRPPFETHLVVQFLGERRVAASIAQTYYAESAESAAARAALAAELKDMPPPLFPGRPTKRDRRLLERWREENDERDC